MMKEMYVTINDEIRVAFYTEDFCPMMEVLVRLPFNSFVKTLWTGMDYLIWSVETEDGVYLYSKDEIAREILDELLTEEEEEIICGLCREMSGI